MKNHKRRTVSYQRKSTKKTDYKKRLNLLKSGKTRLVVRVSSNLITAQFVNYEPAGDRVIISVDSTHLLKKGWDGGKKNLPSAYLVGFLAGKKAAEKGIKEAILDTGLAVVLSGSRIFACMKGVVDAGIEVPHDKSVIPSDERLGGNHIQESLPQKMQKFKETL